MPMRATTVRFSEDLWRLLEREAEREGVSAAQFIRDASVMRAAYAMGAAARSPTRRSLSSAPTATATATPSPPARSGAPMGAEEARRLAAEGERRRAELLEEAARREALLATAAAVQDPARLAALRKTGLLDTPPDPSFDRHARLAAEVLNAPVALVSLSTRTASSSRARSASRSRPPATARRRSRTRSASTRSPSASRSIVEDAREHPLLKHNPAVEELGSVAYAGVPLIDADGYALGTLCVLDNASAPDGPSTRSSCSATSRPRWSTRSARQALVTVEE